MQDRQKQILKLLIEEHIKNPAPVGSKLLMDKTGLGVSSATIRNELFSLEKEKFIAQPHTSAGRIPTQKGYQFYIANYLDPEKISPSLAKNLNEIIEQDDTDIRIKIKQVAKELANASKETVIVSFTKDDIYYTGITNLVSKPEFQETQHLCKLTEVIDHFDRSLDKVYSSIEDKVEILIGKDNPFGDLCSTVITSFNFNDQKAIIALTGPMRMNYNKNYSLIENVTKLLNNLEYGQQEK